MQSSAPASWLTAIAMSSVLIAGPLDAARVSGLYSAAVPAEEFAGQDPRAAFRPALGRVLVKVTGRAEAAADRVMLEQFGDPAALVQQYRVAEDGSVQVGFDEAAVRSLLDSSGQRVWSSERPLTLVWLALDLGGGQRVIVPAGDREDGRGAAPLLGARTGPEVDARAQLLAAADYRGLPVLLPLVDSEDLNAATFADVWGDFAEPIVQASRRYSADAILIGRGRAYSGEATRVRWTLLAGDERVDWDGGIADGPSGAADVLARRLASSVDSSRMIRLRVEGVDGLDGYARAASYLEALGIVERCDVEMVAGDHVVFNLQVRGDGQQLQRTIALREVLVPLDREAADRRPGPTATADLYYRMAGGS